jgi:parvulin-like peptidyl-prolyl isomerase
MFRPAFCTTIALAAALFLASCNAGQPPGTSGEGNPAVEQKAGEEWRDPNADEDLSEPPPAEWDDHSERVTEPGVVALVGDEKISLDEYYSELDKTVRLAGTNALIDEAILALESDRVGLKLTPEDVRAYAEKMENLYIESMMDYVNAEYYGRKTVEEYARETSGMGVEELKARDIKAALESGAAEKRMRIEMLVAYEIYTSARVRIRHIQVNSEDKARDIIRKLQSGVEFGRLVDEESEDKDTRATAGAIYPFHKGDEVFRDDLKRLGPEFLDRVFSAGMGLMAEPVKSARGWHAVMALETQGAREVKLADCRPEVQKIIDAGLNEGDGFYWRERKRAQYKVEIKQQGDVRAVVGDRKITANELRAKSNALFGHDMVLSMIRKRMMAGEAARLGVSNTDDEISAMAAQMADDRIDEEKRSLASRYPMQDDMDALLADYVGMPLEDYKKSIVDAVMTSGEALESLTLSKLVMHYLLTTERVTIQQAVFEDQDSAREAWHKLQQGADFTKLLRAGPGGEQGYDGMLPSFSRDEYEMRPYLIAAGKNIVKVAFATKKGRFSGVFPCGDGWRIVKAIDYQPASDLTYSSLKERIRDENSRSRRWMAYASLWARIKARQMGVAIKLPA